MKKTSINGHGFFRKSKAYGLVCGISIGLAFFGSAVSADETVDTQSQPATEQVTTQTQTVVEPANQGLVEVVSEAESIGIDITQTETESVSDREHALTDYVEQTLKIGEVITQQESINAQNKKIEQTNQENTQAADQAKKTADATNQFVDAAAANYPDATVTTQTADYGSGSAADIKKGEEAVKAIDNANQVAVKNHEAEEAKRAEAISNQAKIDQENHDKLVKFINDNYVRNVTAVTNEIVKPDAIQSLTSNNPNSVVKTEGNITTITTDLGAGESVTHTFVFKQPVIVFDALGIAKIEETIKMISTQSTTGKTGVVQRNAQGGGVFYNTNIPNSTVAQNGLTNYIRTIKYFNADGELVTPETLVKTINAKADGVYGLKKQVATLTDEEVNYNTIKNNDTTNSSIALRYFTAEGVRASRAGRTERFATVEEALAYLQANPATGEYVGTSILQEGRVWDEVNNEYKAIRNSQISHGYLYHMSAKAGTAEDKRSGQSFSFGGGFSAANTDFVPTENIVIPTVSALKLIKVDGTITPSIKPKQANLSASWHLNKYAKTTVTVTSPPAPEPPKPTPPAPKEEEQKIPEPQPVKAAVLPQTGEASSILSLVGSMSLLGLGIFSRKRKK